MFQRLLVLFFIGFFLACKSSEKEYVIYAPDSTLPVLVINDKSLTKAYATFRKTFKEVTHTSLSVSEDIPEEKTAIILEKNPDIKGFSLTLENKRLYIRATDSEVLIYAIHFFFGRYTTAARTRIIVPENLNIMMTPDFEYREPYFPDNQSPENRDRSLTQYLENEWGLWGHNIRKVITITPDMLAKVDNVVKEEQLCFSSIKLEEALIAFIDKQVVENPKAHKFMIMPDDNAQVCMCQECIRVGNTPKHASPAVFSLLNKLASHYPDKEFFGTAYISTRKPPHSGKLPDNVGVMLSTMDFPKGVVLEKSKKATEINELFASWKLLTDKLYVWDYAINFDNYFDFYPTISIAQQNLAYYKRQGVSGIFMQGNEEGYAALEDLKYHLYAALMWNTTTDLEKETKLFLDKKYKTISSLLYIYLKRITQTALISNKELDIYGGVRQSIRKYLDTKQLDVFYRQLLPKASLTTASQNLKKLLLATTFQRLEIARTLGQEAYGYGRWDGEKFFVYPEIIEAVELLERLSKETQVNVYNELGYKLDDYIQYWRREILEKEHSNLLYGKKIRAKTPLDEDYTDVGMLTRGSVGFSDYYNNWLLLTVASEPTFSINLGDVDALKSIQISFLSSPKHRIYLPDKVIVEINGKTFEGIIPEKDQDKIGKYEVFVPVEVEKVESDIVIKIIKQNELKTKTVACDAVIIR